MTLLPRSTWGTDPESLHCPTEEVTGPSLTLVAAGQTERRDGAYDAEDVMRQQGVDLALTGIRLEEG